MKPDPSSRRSHLSHLESSLHSPSERRLDRPCCGVEGGDGGWGCGGAVWAEVAGGGAEDFELKEACPAMTKERHRGPNRNDEVSPDEFRQQVFRCARLLEQYGFKRAQQFEHETPTLVNVVYVGQNVAFIFTLDRRDQMVDFDLARFRKGRVVERSDGGFSDDVYSFLVKHCGYRGGIQPSSDIPSGASLTEQHLSGLVNLLTSPCAAKVLADSEDSLPR